MKNILLVASLCLVRAVCASEPTAAGGFYLDQQPIPVAEACAIMFTPERFHELPSLSVVTPLSTEDLELLQQSRVVQMRRIVTLEHGIWDEWMEALQLSEDHPTIQHCIRLHQCLMGAAGVHRTHPATMELHASQTRPKRRCGKRSPAPIARDRLELQGGLIVAILTVIYVGGLIVLSAPDSS